MPILRRLLLPTALVCFAVAVAAQQRPGPEAPQPPAVKSVATTGQVMSAMTIPASDVLFNVSIEPPKDDDGWAVVTNNAVMLAESGNLLMFGSRVQDTGQWLTMSRALVDVGADALKAAEAKDLKALEATGERLIAVCKECHDVYLK